MRLALVGTRGIPAAYSGFETAVERLSERFTARGHEVTVYCRPHMTERRDSHAGARLVHLPTIRSKHLDTLAHTLVSTAHLATRLRPDVAIYFIAGNAPVVPLARLAGIPSILQIDGLDSERAKWSGPAQAYLRFAERIAPGAATLAVTDSEAVADAYERRFGRRILAIPYGAEVADPGDAGWCRKLGVEPGRFVLFVGRLVPENNAHLLVEAHRLLAPDWPLVVVGDAPYAADYIASLKASAGPGVRFPGYVFGDGYAELVRGCAVMCAPTEVGGTHPVIVEGLAAGAALLVSDHAPNREVVGDAAATFALEGGAAALAGELDALMRDPGRRAELGRRAAARARAHYSWDACADAYLSLCRSVLSRRGRPPAT
ncbi:MAG: glycosyltransferase [Thermoleophilia bacterium]